MRNWNRPPIIAVLVAVAVTALAGCTQREAPGFDPNSQTAKFTEAVAPFGLVYQSSAYDSDNNQTTFTYQLQNTATPGTTPSGGVLGVFTTVMVEVPACAPAPTAVNPPLGAQIYTNTNGIYGVEWGVGYDVNPNLVYTITFPGDVNTGTVRSMVSTGGQRFISNVSGPCEGDYVVDGFVFTDANQNGSKGASELGISNVTVTLTGSEATLTTLSDSDGHYTFTAAAGNYTLSVESSTADNTDYNESLYLDWDQTNSQSRSVTVGPDSNNNDFGWEPDVASIIAKVDAGDITTNGKSYKWWRSEFLRVLNGQSNTAYTGAELLDFVHQIEDMALLDEYDFTPGSEIQQVYNILNNHFFGDDDGNSIKLKNGQGAHDAYSFLVRELLTFELNHVSGRGFDDPALRAALINWGEGLLKNNAPAQPSSGPQGSSINEPQRLLESPLEGGGTIFRKGNGATGGGGVGG